MENSCRNIQEQILELVTGSLPTEKVVEIQRHISQCPACSEYLRALEADDKLLGDFAEAMQPTVARLEKNVIDALDRKVSEKPIGSISIWRTIVKSKISKLAAAAVIIIAVLVGVHHFGGSIDGTAAAFAQVAEAMAKMPWMHKVSYIYEDGKEHCTETWYSFGSKINLLKYSLDGECQKISSLNYNNKEYIVYDPNANLIEIGPHPDLDVSHSYHPESPWLVMDHHIESYEARNAVVEHEKGQYEGVGVDIYHFMIAHNERGETERSKLIIDRNSHLPIVFERKFWKGQGKHFRNQVIRFDFPEDGPKDIYELGVPQSAVVKAREESGTPEQQELPVWRQRFDVVYRLEDGQVLKRIAPPFIPERENYLEKSPDYLAFYWDGELKDAGYGFTGGKRPLSSVLRTIGIARNEFEGSKELLGIEVLGDWIIRKDTPDEELLLALEKILLDEIGSEIHFVKRKVKREVVIAQGKYLFLPIPGTYDDSVVHIYSDKLDPDERGGGGSGTVLEFLKWLSDSINMNVINQTKSSNVKLCWRNHYSGYLRKIKDDTQEYHRRLGMLLDILERQTGFTFNIEQRIVEKWVVIEGEINPENLPK